eukprot:gene58237-biopygen117264
MIFLALPGCTPISYFQGAGNLAVWLVGKWGPDGIPGGRRPDTGAEHFSNCTNRVTIRSIGCIAVIASRDVAFDAAVNGATFRHSHCSSYCSSDMGSHADADSGTQGIAEDKDDIIALWSTIRRYSHGFIACHNCDAVHHCMPGSWSIRDAAGMVGINWEGSVNSAGYPKGCYSAAVTNIGLGMMISAATVCNNGTDGQG